MRRLSVRAVGCALLLGMLPAAVHAAATPFPPTAYLQESDVPAGFYNSICPHFVEDFEDMVLDDFLTITPGRIIGPTFSSGNATTDSVDADDGTIDGLGVLGHSWFAQGARSITVAFDGLVTSAGLVFTDGDINSTNVSLEAFNGATSLGIINGGDLADGSNNGETPEDRFMGFLDQSGITSIKLTVTGGSGIEIDHVQWQNCVIPEPATMGTALLGLLGIVGWRRRRR